MNPASTAPGTRPRPGCPASSSPRHPLRRGVRPLHPGRGRPLAPRPPRLGGHHVDAWAVGQPDGARDAVRVDRRGLVGRPLRAPAADGGQPRRALAEHAAERRRRRPHPLRRHPVPHRHGHRRPDPPGHRLRQRGRRPPPATRSRSEPPRPVSPSAASPPVSSAALCCRPGTSTPSSTSVSSRCSSSRSVPAPRAEGAAEPAPGASAGRLRALLAPGPPPHHPALLGRHLRRTRHRLRRQHLAAHPDGRLRLRPQLLAGVLHRLERGRRPRHPGRRRRRRRRRPGLPQGRHPHQLPLRHRRDDHPAAPRSPGPYCCSPPPSSAAAPSVPRPWSTSTSLTRTLPRCAAPRSASAWGWAGSAPSPAPATCRRSPSWSPRRRQASTRLWSRPSSARSSPACSGRVRAAPGRLGPTRRTPR